MRQLIVKQLDYDLTPVASLDLVGHYLKALRPVLGRLEVALPVKSGVANSDVVRSYLGLLVQGKSDFDAIENSAATCSTSKRWASRCCHRARCRDLAGPLRLVGRAR